MCFLSWYTHVFILVSAGPLDLSAKVLNDTSVNVTWHLDEEDLPLQSYKLVYTKLPGVSSVKNTSKAILLPKATNHQLLTKLSKKTGILPSDLT